MPPAARPASAPRPEARPWRRLWFHVWVLSALAAAPLLDVVRRHPEFLVANDFGFGRLAALLVVVLVVAPAPLVLAAWWLRGRGAATTGLLVAGPALVLGLQLGDRLGLGGGSTILAVACAGLAAILYRRSAAVRSYVTWLSLVALVAPAHLLLDPAVRRLAASGDRAAAAPAAAGRATPVVVLLLDELPTTTVLDDAGRLDGRRFPNLARLAARAHWFENVEAVDPSTPKAVAAVLTGTPLPADRLPIAADMPFNLFTLLAPGHRIHALEPVTRLCPTQLNALTNRERLLRGGSWMLDVAILALHLWTPEPWSQRWLPPIHAAWGDFAAPLDRPRRRRRGRSLWGRLLGVASEPALRDRAERFRRFLGQVEDRPGTELYFAHLMLPHRPWIYLPDGRLYFADSYREMRDFLREEWPAERELADQAYQRHLLQAEFTDRLIGEWIDRLEAVGLFEPALIAVTADHGISFRPGDAVRTVTPTNREDLLRVPLLLKLPGQRAAARHSEPRSTLDLLPTLLELLEIAPPAGLAGRPLPLVEGTPSAPPPQWTGLERRRSVFGPLEREEDLFRFGRHAHLVGAAVEELAPEPHPEVAVALRGEGHRLVVEADDPVLPAWVFGYLESAVDLDGFGVAVAVDGKVAATTVCRSVEGRIRFNALLPPAVLPPGEHHLELLLLEPGSGAAWRVAQGGSGTPPASTVSGAPADPISASS